MKSPTPARQSFTLIELLVVIVIIALLAAITLGVGRYADTNAKVTRARAEVAAMETGIENFKSDQGFYPTSSIVRVSCTSLAEATNSSMLYQALINGPTRYMRFYPRQIKNPYNAYYAGDKAAALLGTVNTNVIVDPWGRPYNYYRPWPPQPVSINVNPYVATNNSNAFLGQWIGGQVNTVSYDLWSYGPDMQTYAGSNGTTVGDMNWLPQGTWSKAATVDDIGNFKQ